MTSWLDVQLRPLINLPYTLQCKREKRFNCFCHKYKQWQEKRFLGYTAMFTLTAAFVFVKITDQFDKGVEEGNTHFHRKMR
jgi:hypothetical protein